MAQIRYPGAAPAHVSAVAGPVVVITAEQASRNVQAFAVLFSGLFAATSLLFFAMGKDRAGYMLGVTGALLGAVLGATQIIAGD